jgi:tetratricopeptide (TPR) repeat protein
MRGSAPIPLIGRDEEIDLLLRRWARAKARVGQVVLISGEPGIGKSRIAVALAERLQTEPCCYLRYFCSPHHQDSALFPFIDHLGRASGFARDDPPTTKLGKLGALLSHTEPPDEDVALLADLLSLAASERHAPPNLSPQRKKERTLEALIRHLEGLTRRSPLLIVFEDVHWIDPTSRELLDLVVDRLRTLPALLIVTFRPEFKAPWTSQAQVTMLALSRFDRRDRTALITQIAGDKALPDEVVIQIADRTDGVPLFVEELTKSVLESGHLREEADCYVLDGALLALAIPTSLHASLMARLDRSVSGRRVAQIGAAIGREFGYALLRDLGSLAEDELQGALAQLVASELVFQRGAPPDAVYTFKHTLVQDAAHGSLLRNDRQQLHAQIAEALETQSPELTDAQPELLAQHCAAAGLVEKAGTYWSKAGHRSVTRSAMAEAAALFQRALDQLALLPANITRKREELELLRALGGVLLALKGMAAPEMHAIFSRARELWEQLGSPSEFLQIRYGQSRYHAYRGELDLALRIEDLIRLSRERNDTAGLVMGYGSSGRTLMLLGRFPASYLHFGKALALFDPTCHRSLVHETAFHLDVMLEGYLGIVLACRGFPQQALIRAKSAIVEARKLAHPPSLAATLAPGVLVASQVEDDSALGEWADQMVTITTDQGFPLWRALGTIFRAWALIRNGGIGEGMPLLRSALKAFQATSAEGLITCVFGPVARAFEIAGQPEEALTALDHGLQIGERTGAHWFAAELTQLKGELQLRHGNAEAAEKLYCKALSVAREQEAKLWELRAATNLARLWRDQGRCAAARDLLAPVYGWFTEGFATPNLKAAKMLLEELNA